MEKVLELLASCAGVRPAVGKTGKTGYYVSVLRGGVPETWFTSHEPSFLSGWVKNQYGSFVPKESDIMPVVLTVGVRSYKGVPALDLLSVVLS